jgi:hypothetical protein
MLSNINFKEGVGNLFNKKLNWLKAMPISRRKDITKLYYYNPEKEELCNKLIKLFPNLKYVKTNMTRNRLLANYITNYDLIIINNYENRFTRDFLIEQVQSLTEQGKLWIFCNRLNELNILIEDIENKFNLTLDKFNNKYDDIKEILDDLSTNYFETKVEYTYDIHIELYNFITRKYIPLETKLAIKSYLISTFSTDIVLSEQIFMLG